MPDHDHVDDRIRRAWADLAPEDGTHPPLPATAWDRVAREVADEAAGPADPAASGTGLSAPGTDPGPPAADTTSLRRPPSGGRSVLLVAAVLLLVLAVTGGVAALGAIGSDDPTLAAEAALSSEGLTGAEPATGRAELLRVDERRVLDVSVPDVRAADGTVLEVWLIDPASDGLQSLGTIVDGDGPTRLPVPDAIDVARFSVVDVSVEPLDGDPSHSADSVVRGPLAPT